MIAGAVALLVLADSGPYSLEGRFVDLAPEGVTWGVPAEGAPILFSLASDKPVQGEQTVGLTAGGAQGQLSAKFRYASGVVDAEVKLADTKGSLSGTRFDAVAIRETYRAVDKDGKPVELTRSKPLVEDSPILFGDMREGEASSSHTIRSSGIAWGADTVKLDIVFQVSGFGLGRTLFPDHANSRLAFDHKGRLLVGSGQVGVLFRADLDTGNLSSVASLPDYRVNPSVNPVDGTIAASYINAQSFRLLSPGGDDKGEIAQVPDAAGMTGWPDGSAFDGKGRMYVMFGSTIARLSGGKPDFVLSEALGFEFSDYPHFAVAKDGTIFVANGSNLFRFEEGGKSPKKIVQGEDWRPGRMHGQQAVALDEQGGAVWVASNNQNEYAYRVDSFDRSGKFLFAIGRGAQKPCEPAEFWDAQCPAPVSIAIAPDGRVFVANYESARSVMEFVPIRASSLSKP